METAVSEVVIKSFASKKQSFWRLTTEEHKQLEMCEDRVKEKKKKKKDSRKDQIDSETSFPDSFNERI